MQAKSGVKTGVECVLESRWTWCHQLKNWRWISFSVICLLLVSVGFGLPTTASAHGDMDPEIHEITEELEKEPNSVRLWIKRGQVVRSYGRFEEALADFKKAGELDPKNVQVQLDQSITLSSMGQNEEAEAGLNAVLQKDLGRLKIFALAERAAIRVRTNRPELAIEDYTAVLGLQPTSEIYYRRGKLQESLGRFEEAAQNYQEGIAKLGQAIVLKKALIETRIKQKKFKEALQLIDEQIRLMPVKTQPYFQRAEVLEKMGKRNEAQQAYEQALSEANRILEKRRTAIHLVARARILRAMGQRQEALSDVREALQKAPRFEEAEQLFQEWNEKKPESKKTSDSEKPSDTKKNLDKE
jgi:tetratricopeptide (TPR) repeat protein